MTYRFNEAINQKLEGLEKYLQHKQFSPATIRQYRNYSGLYLEWLVELNMEAQEVDYHTFTDFILQLKDRYSINQSRRIILAVRHYYQSLAGGINPASGIYMQMGRAGTVVQQIVPYETLTGLYEQYPTLDDRGKRNKVILGLLIFQGITTAGLHSLEPGHIKLKQSKIYIPATGKTNSRALDLQAAQLLDLQEYLLVIRHRMLADVKADRPGRKPTQVDPRIHDQLFFSQNGSSNIKESLHHLFRMVRRTHPKITSGLVIRTSVIADWLKTKDIRMVQYMAGHRYVSSTERYDAHKLKELKESLKKHHPLK